jgi:hypothetical protein
MYIREEEDYDDLIIEQMWDFIDSLDDNQISDEQAGQIEDILDEVFKLRVRRNLSNQRKNRREYRRKRARVKMKGRRYRRSARGKMRAKRAKRMARTGKTSTGKRMRKFVGPKLGGPKRRR